MNFVDICSDRERGGGGQGGYVFICIVCVFLQVKKMRSKINLMFEKEQSFISDFEVKKVLRQLNDRRGEVCYLEVLLRVGGKV